MMSATLDGGLAERLLAMLSAVGTVPTEANIERPAAAQQMQALERLAAEASVDGVAMEAGVDAGSSSRQCGIATLLSCQGRSYPVKTIYLGPFGECMTPSTNPSLCSDTIIIIMLP